MYEVLSAKIVDFVDPVTNRPIKGTTVWVRCIQNSNDSVYFGVEPVRLFFPLSVDLPTFQPGVLYDLVYDMCGSKPKVIAIKES